MKITAGMGSVDDYIRYADVGADELFCGYVPEKWAQRYGLALPINRREVRYYNVQLGARSELLILADQIAKRGVPVTLTLNSLYYIEEQYPLLGDLVSQCIDDGFRSFIIADPALLLWLHRQGLDRSAQLHISGEMSEVNHAMLAMVGCLGARRIIFHRKVTLSDMAACIAWAHSQPDAVPVEFEAFALNELCHFHGAFCNSLHCDELAHMCRVPYVLGGIQAPLTAPDDAFSVSDPTALGASGCGLCALWRMQQAGVTHLKLVGRGNLSDLMVRDIAALRRAADLAAECPDEQTYLSSMKRTLFPRGCQGACYYLGEFGAAGHEPT